MDDYGIFCVRCTVIYLTLEQLNLVESELVRSRNIEPVYCEPVHIIISYAWNDKFKFHVWSTPKIRFKNLHLDMYALTKFYVLTVRDTWGYHFGGSDMCSMVRDTHILPHKGKFGKVHFTKILKQSILIWHVYSSGTLRVPPTPTHFSKEMS